MTLSGNAIANSRILIAFTGTIAQTTAQLPSEFGLRRRTHVDRIRRSQNQPPTGYRLCVQSSAIVLGRGQVADRASALYDSAGSVDQGRLLWEATKDQTKRKEPGPTPS